MISSRNPVPVGIIAILLGTLAAGCKENSIDQGILVHAAEAHYDTRPGELESAPTEIPPAVDVQGGYDSLAIEHHPVADVNGTVLALYRAYLVIDEIELVRCDTRVSLPRSLLDFFIPAASAHAGHGSVPVGGRALDRPNVIDIVTQEGFYLPLGDMPAEPGLYCAIRVALTRLAGEAYGEPEPEPASSDDPTTVPDIPEMHGFVFAMRSDYCDAVDAGGSCTHRTKVDIDDRGLAPPVARTLAFDRPLDVGDTRREAYVAIGIVHGDWLKNVDVTLLNSDIGEVQKLLDNIAASFYVDATGLGELPPNIPGS